MKIRFECPDCGSVLKIRAEKAGQRGKCPKCKSAFTIPEALNDEKSLLTEADLIDMPLEVTPVAVVPEKPVASGEFDPHGVLNSHSNAEGAAQPAAANEFKPSVAELMKEHQEKLAKDRIRRDRQESRRASPLLADVETSGSAADAITRRYEKKREESDETQVLSREQRRAAENRAALMRFAVQLVMVLLATTLFGYLLFNYVLSPDGPNLVDVTGKVTLRGEPTMTGYTIIFTPIQQRNAPKLEASGSAARINNNGEFELYYKPAIAGAVIATHQVTIENEFGVVQPMPEDYSQCKVTADGENHFEFNF